MNVRAIVSLAGFVLSTTLCAVAVLAQSTGRPLDRTVGDSVYAATVVTEGWLHVRAQAVGQATRAGWVVHTLEHLPSLDTRATDFAAHYVDRQVVPALCAQLRSLGSACGKP